MVDTIANTDLIRTRLYSEEIKTVLESELQLDKACKWFTDFTDGTTYVVPTVGQLTVRNYVEGNPITIDEVDSGEFTLTIDKYYSSAFAITDKFKQDSKYIAKAESMFVMELTKSIARQKESDVANLQSAQTASNANNINGFAHRMVASGSNGVIAESQIRDMALSLSKARCPKAGRRAFVDSTVTHTMTGLANIITQTIYGANSAVKENLSGTNYLGKYYGFDFYENFYLDNALSETIGGSVTDGMGNLFLGTDDAFVGAMRLEPELEDFREPMRKRHVYTALSRYGVKTYRPEAVGVILSSATVNS